MRECGAARAVGVPPRGAGAHGPPARARRRPSRCCGAQSRSGPRRRPRPAAPAASVHRRVCTANPECDRIYGVHADRRSAPRQKQQHPRNSRGFGYLHGAALDALYRATCDHPRPLFQAMYSFSWLKPGQIFDCYLVPFNQLWLTLQATVTPPAKPPEKVNASKYNRTPPIAVNNIGKAVPCPQTRDC